MKLTLIIPLRVSDQVYQAIGRLKEIIKIVPSELYNILIVDYGTCDEFRDEIHLMSSSAVRIIREDCVNKPFSIGHARDLGVQHATDSIVMFHDIDFLCSTTMYERIHSEVEARNLLNNAYDFFCVPVFFLTEFGSKLAKDILSEKNSDICLQRLVYTASPAVVEFAAFGSSAIVVNKWHYLSIGGHSREFFGHGAEDYDLLHRLAHFNPKGPRTKDYYIDTKSNSILEYRGFRSYFALYGIDVFSRFIFQIHLWHPKREIVGYQQSNRNFKLLPSLMERFDKRREQPLPLPDRTICKCSLLLMRPNTSSFSAIRQAIPLLGEYKTRDENDFKNGEKLIEYCRERGIHHVLFLNPYGNEHRLELYKAIRSTEIGYYVFDRGALPNSWFFDPRGFNYDSLSYAPDIWDKPLSTAETEFVEEFKTQLKNGDDALEENGIRRTAHYYRETLGISDKRVLFVPFQRPSDTVTTHFAGAALSVFNFQAWIKKLAENLPKRDWCIVCKNHPLDKNLPQVEGVIYAPQEAHINDLIELADKVLLMNSGVGVISLAFEKPVICTSNAFYCHDGLAHQASSPDEILSLINAEIAPNKQKVNSFLHHLVTEIYSFGKSIYKNVQAGDGSARRLVTEIQFDDLRLPLLTSQKFGKVANGVSLDSPLFWSFGGRHRIKMVLDQKALPVTMVKPTEHRSSLPLPINSSLLPSIFNKKLKKFKKYPWLFIRDFFLNRM